MVEARTYAFRIVSFLSIRGARDSRVEIDLPDPASGAKLILPLPEETGDSGRTLLLTRGGYSSPAEARGAGEQLKTALMLAGPLLGQGIDVGSDEELSGAPSRSDGQPDERLQAYVHGLQVVPEVSGMLFGFVFFGGVETKLTANQLGDQLAGGIAKCHGRTLDARGRITAQLYNQSHFHEADTARFITLVSAVEVLAEQRSQSQVVVDFVDRMIAALAAAKLGEPEELPLRSRLGELKRQSIGAACTELVRLDRGPIAAERFREAYSVRSRILHEGMTPSDADLKRLISDLDVIVRNLVLHRSSAG